MGRAGWSGATSEPINRLGWSWRSSDSSPARIARPVYTTDRDKERVRKVQVCLNVNDEALNKVCMNRDTTRTLSRSTSARRSFSQQ